MTEVTVLSEFSSYRIGTELAAGVFTWNVYDNDRLDLLTRTLRSIFVEEVPVFVIDNGSTDGTEDLVVKMKGIRNRGVSTIGGGMNFTVRAVLTAEPDIVVLSNDDVVWRPGWAQQVRRFWADAPDDVAICAGILEPEWAWNTIAGVHEIGGQQVLERATVPGGAWTFRAETWKAIEPVPDWSNSESDVPTCRKLTTQGWRLMAADWAVHEGDGRSIWGNPSHTDDEPLDKQKWGLT